MKNYYRVMLGEGSKYAEEAYNGKFIGAGWFGGIDLSNKLSGDKGDFNNKFIPVYLNKYPEASKRTAGHACGALYTIAKELLIGDIVLCPDGNGNYFIGQVDGNYKYKKNQIFPHRRSVRWYSNIISPNEMSKSLRNSVRYSGTVSNISRYATEINRLILSARSNPNTNIVEKGDAREVGLKSEENSFGRIMKQKTRIRKIHNILTNKFIGCEQMRKYKPEEGYFDLLIKNWRNNRMLLIEAKTSSSGDGGRTQIRQAIGQLFDYRRNYVGGDISKIDLAILLPVEPEKDVEELFCSLNINILWFDGKKLMISSKGKINIF